MSTTNGHAQVDASPRFAALALTFELLHPKELVGQTDLLDDIKRLVNESYAGSHTGLESRRGVPEHSVFPRLRYGEANEVVDEMLRDKVKIVALCFDDESSRSVKSASRKLVGVGNVKPWKGTVVTKFRRRQEPELAKIHDDLDPEDQYEEFEIGLCASLSGPQYRGVGIVSETISRMVDSLARQAGEQPQRYWITALDETGNKQYWERRGYTEKRTEVGPVGMWGNIQPITVVTLRKELPKTNGFH